MRHPISWSGATLAAFLLAAVPSARSEEAPSTALVQALTACRPMAEVAARAACYDRATDGLTRALAEGNAVLIDQQQARTVRRHAFGLKIAPSLLPAGAREDAPPSRLAYRLAAPRRSGDGSWILTTEEGVTWLQTDSAHLSRDPSPGLAMSVSKGALGSFFCELPREAAIRCRRQH